MSTKKTFGEWWKQATNRTQPLLPDGAFLFVMPLRYVFGPIDNMAPEDEIVIKQQITGEGDPFEWAIDNGLDVRKTHLSLIFYIVPRNDAETVLIKMRWF